ncbi:POU domain protein [Aphelenchoides fujianensis]|nr:POU domain protein [Aphelenchoides fujianensis]
MNPAQRIYPSLNSFAGMDRYSPTPYRQRMQQALAEMDVKNVNMPGNMLRPTDMFSNYHSQNLLNSSNSELIDNSGIAPTPSNLIDPQSSHANSNDTMNSLQQVMAMQHHYPGTAHFPHYHQLPQASVAGVAAAFGAPHSSGMNIVGGNGSVAGGFIGNPLNPTPNNNLLPRYSLGHATTSSFAPEIDTDPRELERFAEHFKQRRIKLGVTQADVGKALAHLKMPGVGITKSVDDLPLRKPHPLAQQHGRSEAHPPVVAREVRTRSGRGRRLPAPEKRLLEDYFRQQPRPTGDRISAIAEKLDLKKNVVRVWFCNQRQKQKRQFRCRSQTNNGITNLHGGCQQQQQPNGNSTELKYNPNAGDVKRQLLSDDFLQVPNQTAEGLTNNI